MNISCCWLGFMALAGWLVVLMVMLLLLSLAGSQVCAACNSTSSPPEVQIRKPTAVQHSMDPH